MVMEIVDQAMAVVKAFHPEFEPRILCDDMSELGTKEGIEVPKDNQCISGWYP